ncbi:MULTISPECIES: type II secretion system protein [Pseudoalteromonas]|uniref:type II secretion system protein n=1 Tax=Pseudoalteromonas TaxID=53246 RepID=UPI0006D63D01|nr:prepilin-type N-terminal cleavage/methylation domain-containing protein [Pseudoalteromonas sp. P1-9]KPV96823.1 Fimbrial protein precursor [Pseudoalteromonas sp. P1-9]
MKKNLAKNTGFTLIEMIIVVIILGLLAVTALPRFIDIQEEAERSTVEGVAGGLAAAVGLVRGQWEVLGRPDNNTATNFIDYDTTRVGIDPDIGYPTSGVDAANNEVAGSTEVTALNTAKCQAVFNSVLQSAPSSTTSAAAATVEENTYLVRFVNNGSVDGASDTCLYYLVSALDLTALPGNALDTNLRGIEYSPATGVVRVFGN